MSIVTIIFNEFFSSIYPHQSHISIIVISFNAPLVFLVSLGIPIDSFDISQENKHY